MEAYYASLAATAAADEQRAAHEIAKPRDIDLSKPFQKMPNALSMEAARALYGSPLDSAAPLDASNVGHRMLQKMGWEDGTGLGKHRSGITEPVQAEVRAKGAGVGAHGFAGDVRLKQTDDRERQITLIARRLILMLLLRAAG
jgi:hypothetical protein